MFPSATGSEGTGLGRHRTIFIGDVQGCADELEDLLAVLSYDPVGDAVYFVGDIVNRGPESLRCLKIARRVASGIVMGNHEAWLLQGGFFTAREIAPDAWPRLADLAASSERMRLGEWVRTWPLLLHLGDLCLVHAAVPPSLWRAADASAIAVWRDQRLAVGRPLAAEEEFILRARYCSPDGRLPNEDDPPPGPPYAPWDSFYEGTWTVVFGHWARRGLVSGQRTRGLDTGCVYGGSLTAWIAEEDRIIQVPARRAYYP